MTIAFLIGRQPEYRIVGPIIDEALRRGMAVECWLDASWSRDGLKAYQFPDAGNAPAFRYGRPVFRTFDGDDHFHALLRTTGADAIFACGPPPAASAASQHPFWVAVQHNGPDFLISHEPADLLRADIVALYSDWWREWMIDYFAAEERIADRGIYARELGPRVELPGSTAVDGASRIDADEVRARWNIPPKQPVVLLLPFPQGVGKAAFWPRGIFAEPSRLRQGLKVLKHRKFEYWPQVFGGVRDIDIVQAIRRFCDRHGAYLLVKSRLKTPIPSYTADVADRCVYDESYYPATVLEALTIADLCISYYSLAVIEAAPLGVPTLTFALDGRDYCGDNDWMVRYFHRFFERREGGLFQFAGVTTTVEIPEAVRFLDRVRLDEFRMDPAAQGRYVERYLTSDDGAAAARLLDRVVAAAPSAGRRASVV